MRKQRTHILIGISQEQKQEITEVAAAHRLTVSEFIRETLHQRCAHYRRREEEKRLGGLYGSQGGALGGEVEP